MIDPSGYAPECPIIVAGTIEKIAVAAPGRDRADDIASSRILAVHRHELTDVGLKAGDLLPVRMISRNNRVRASTDLNYPVGTKAIWLVKLTNKGEFRIDLHPVQKQPFQLTPTFRLLQEASKKAGNAAGAGKVANPSGSQSTAEWIAAQQAGEGKSAGKRGIPKDTNTLR